MKSFISLPVISLSLICLLCLGVGLFKARSAKSDESMPELKVVDHVDVEKYAKKWYTIASIPQIFTRACAGGTTATYTLREDGDINVYNACFKDDGSVYDVNGRAWVVDRESNAKLKVSFLPFGLKFFGGDYWIIDLGKDYEYAVVGHPERKYAWILSDKPSLPEDVLKGIIERLEAKGYDFSDFQMVKQEGYWPAGE